MRASKLLFSILVLTLFVSGGIQAQEDPVTTTRDAQGIWFIEGGSLYDVFEAQGYAVSTDRMWQLELFRRQARGKTRHSTGQCLCICRAQWRALLQRFKIHDTRGGNAGY